MRNGKSFSETIGITLGIATFTLLSIGYWILFWLPSPMGIVVSIALSLVALTTGYLMIISLKK